MDNKKIRVAINGFGRIGRAAFRIILEKHDNIEIVAINDLTDSKTLAHLLKYDSVYGQFNGEVNSGDKKIIVNGQDFNILSETDPGNLPWEKLEVDVVLECTGVFRKMEEANRHISAGAQKVIISAPSKSEKIGVYVIGVNDQEIPKDAQVISNASCTTNCVAPIMKVLEDSFGVEKALMTTIHSYTSSQKIVDSPCKNLREARAAAENLIPTDTGAATTSAKVLPALLDKFDGMAVRVPTPVGSLTDITVVLKKDADVESINSALIDASKSDSMKNILTVTEDPIVSSDIIGNPHSAIVDLALTKVVGGNLVKIVAWYDNEWGYGNRLVELVHKLMV
ncbi:type I glyceraldehyde-3-phosphate dehydrogenase [bacterium]|nr:MAG: type I glyceraldehyde-3-phosphate dehydrogenase [bacterium]